MKNQNMKKEINLQNHKKMLKKHKNFHEPTSKETEESHGGDEASKEIKDSPNTVKDEENSQREKKQKKGKRMRMKKMQKPINMKEVTMDKKEESKMSDIRENKQALNNLMQKIGNAVLPVLENGWEKVVIGYFIEISNVTHLQFFVLNKDEDDYSDLVKLSWDTERYDDAIINIEDLCKELHTLCKQVNDSWTSFSYILEGDGTYNADYGYDDIESYDSRFIMEWQSKYLD